jgi:PAS domain S-box-containing protein
VSPETELLEESAEDLYEAAPCGYLSTRPDGTIVKVNTTFETLTGYSRADLVQRVRFQDLLSPGGRIYHETHYAPLLRMQGTVREIALDLIRKDGSSLPVLINSVVRNDEAGRPRMIRTTVFDATDRRRYEEELLRMRNRERDTAQRLQRSLLSGELPQSDAFELAVLYSPASSHTMAGGDWYDAFWTEDGRRLALVVGDVVGRGIPAAAVMGQLRSAVRALADTGVSPAELIGALDGYSRRHSVGMMTTLVYAELDLGERSLRFSVAGHPPPVLQRAGEATFNTRARSLPLNPWGEPIRRADGCLALEAGDTLWLYTDGLIERRRKGRDEMQQLLAAIAADRSATLSEAVRSVARAVDDGDQDDDCCILALRLPRPSQSSYGVDG